MHARRQRALQSSVGYSPRILHRLKEGFDHGLSASGILLMAEHTVRIGIHQQAQEVALAMHGQQYKLIAWPAGYGLAAADGGAVVSQHESRHPLRGGPSARRRNGSEALYGAAAPRVA